MSRTIELNMDVLGVLLAAFLVYKLQADIAATRSHVSAIRDEVAPHEPPTWHVPHPDVEDGLEGPTDDVEDTEEEDA